MGPWVRRGGHNRIQDNPYANNIAIPPAPIPAPDSTPPTTLNKGVLQSVSIKVTGSMMLFV